MLPADQLLQDQMTGDTGMTASPVPVTPTVATPEQPDPEQPAAGRSRGRRWLRRLVVLCLLATVGYLFRAPLLSGLAAPLITEEPISTGSTVFLLDRENTIYDEAARLYQAKATPRIYLFRGTMLRTERLNLVPPQETLACQELVRRGLPEAAVSLLPRAERNSWAFAARLSEWLAEQPQETAVLLCNRFGSRRVRYVLDHALNDSDRGRVLVMAVVNPCHDETNWWQRKEGLLDLFNNYLRLGYSWTNGDTGPAAPDWDPDEYERSLREVR